MLYIKRVLPSILIDEERKIVSILKALRKRSTDGPLCLHFTKYIVHYDPKWWRKCSNNWKRKS